MGSFIKKNSIGKLIIISILSVSTSSVLYPNDFESYHDSAKNLFSQREVLLVSPYSSGCLFGYKEFYSMMNRWNSWLSIDFYSCSVSENLKIENFSWHVDCLIWWDSHFIYVVAILLPGFFQDSLNGLVYSIANYFPRRNCVLVRLIILWFNLFLME